MNLPVRLDQDQQETVCGVCGECLTESLVACPECQTLHHLDCWTYNQGCAVYGCPGVDGVDAPERDLEVPALVEEQGLALSLDWGVLAGGTVVMAILAGLLLPFVVALPVLVLIPLGLLVRLMESSQEGPGPEAFWDQEDVSWRQEAKEITARIGGGVPHDLARCYALFEQRHPRARLDQKAQQAVAEELLGAGYLVLGREAWEKLLLRARGSEKATLRQAYRGLFRDDPAFMAEALGLAAVQTSRGKIDPRPLLDGSDQYLLSLSLQGFPAQWHHPGRLPTEILTDLPRPAGRIAGPFGVEEIAERMQELEEMGYLAIPTTQEELRLPARILRPARISLTPKGARFQTSEEDLCFPWDEVHSFFYERVERVEHHQEMVVVEDSRKGRGRVRFQEKTTSETRFDSLVEIHVGSPLRRYRIDRAEAGLIEYLGRRRTLSFEVNLKLVAKDLARFAPGARACRYAVAMLSERQSQEPTAASERELEERLLWFSALGSPRIRSWWQGFDWG